MASAISWLLRTVLVPHLQGNCSEACDHKVRSTRSGHIMTCPEQWDALLDLIQRHVLDSLETFNADTGLMENNDVEGLHQVMALTRAKDKKYTTADNNNLGKIGLVKAAATKIAVANLSSAGRENKAPEEEWLPEERARELLSLSLGLPSLLPTRWARAREAKLLRRRRDRSVRSRTAEVRARADKMRKLRRSKANSGVVEAKKVDKAGTGYMMAHLGDDEVVAPLPAPGVSAVSAAAAAAAVAPKPPRYLQVVRNSRRKAGCKKCKMVGHTEAKCTFKHLFAV